MSAEPGAAGPETAPPSEPEPAAPSKPKAKRARSPGLSLGPAGVLPLKLPLATAMAFLSGVLYWLAFAGMDVWPVAFVAWVPLLVAMHRQTTKRAALLAES